MSSLKPEILNELCDETENDQVTLSLNLGSRKLDDGELAALLTANEINTCLTSLKLCSPDLKDQHARELINLPRLASLSLSYSQIPNQVAFTLAKMTNLTSLELRESKIKDKDVITLTVNARLLSLSLCNNEIGDLSAVALAKHTHLTLLDLSGNQITDQGAIALANNTVLTDLNIGYSQITNEGAIALATKNTTLKKLNVHHNKIEKPGALALANNIYLHFLVISYNKIGEETVQNVNRAMLLNRKAKQLQFVESAIVIAQAKYQPKNQTSINILPREVLLIILAYVASNTGFPQEQVTLVCGFIFKTIRDRENWHLAVQALPLKQRFFKEWNPKDRSDVLSRYTMSATTTPQAKQASVADQEISLDESKSSSLNMF